MTEAPDTFWTYADVAPSTDACHHCGRLPDSDGDHTCACPNSDATCAAHPTRDADTATALAGIRALLRLMGEDAERPGLVGTPARVVKAYLEMAARPGNPGHDLATVFADIDHPNTPVIVGPIPFVSLCEHHLLPFTGDAWVAYVPALGRVVGLSKLPRTVHHFAARPQVQERLTQQIADALTTHLDPTGVAVLVRGQHSCMSLRGAKTPGTMETSDLRGSLAAQPFRGMFLDAARGHR